MAYTQRKRMVSLGKPKPVVLPSERKENAGQDPNVSLVPNKRGGWGALNGGHGSRDDDNLGDAEAAGASDSASLPGQAVTSVRCTHTPGGGLAWGGAGLPERIQEQAEAAKESPEPNTRDSTCGGARHQQHGRLNTRPGPSLRPIGPYPPVGQQPEIHPSLHEDTWLPRTVLSGSSVPAEPPTSTWPPPDVAPVPEPGRRQQQTQSAKLADRPAGGGVHPGFSPEGNFSAKVAALTGRSADKPQHLRAAKVRIRQQDAANANASIEPIGEESRPSAAVHAVDAEAPGMSHILSAGSHNREPRAQQAHLPRLVGAAGDQMHQSRPSGRESVGQHPAPLAPAQGAPSVLPAVLLHPALQDVAVRMSDNSGSNMRGQKPPGRAPNPSSHSAQSARADYPAAGAHADNGMIVGTQQQEKTATHLGRGDKVGEPISKHIVQAADTGSDHFRKGALLASASSAVDRNRNGRQPHAVRSSSVKDASSATAKVLPAEDEREQIDSSPLCKTALGSDNRQTGLKRSAVSSNGQKELGSGITQAVRQRACKQGQVSGWNSAARDKDAGSVGHGRQGGGLSRRQPEERSHGQESDGKAERSTGHSSGQGRGGRGRRATLNQGVPEGTFSMSNEPSGRHPAQPSGALDKGRGGPRGGVEMDNGSNPVHQRTGHRSRRASRPSPGQGAVQPQSAALSRAQPSAPAARQDVADTQSLGVGNATPATPVAPRVFSQALENLAKFRIKEPEIGAQK